MGRRTDALGEREPSGVDLVEVDPERSEAALHQLAEGQGGDDGDLQLLRRPFICGGKLEDPERGTRL
jgi:hypothetical protein